MRTKDEFGRLHTSRNQGDKLKVHDRHSATEALITDHVWTIGEMLDRVNP
jgi:hypothetical protein